MKKLRVLLPLLLFSAPLFAGFSLGRPAAVKKRVDKLDAAVSARLAAPGNRAPLISYLTLSASTIAAGGVSRVSATASDPDGDALSYVWTSTAGTLSGSGASVYWRAPVTPGVYALTCTVSDSKAAALRSASVTAVAPGTVKWTFTTAGAAGAAPVIGGDGTIYAVDDAGYVYAINMDGTTKWAFSHGPAPQPIYYSPTVAADGTVYYADFAPSVYALDASGTEKWGPISLPAAGIDASPVIGPDGKIYVYDATGGAIYSLDPADGTSALVFSGLGTAVQPPVSGPDGALYITVNDGADDIVYAIPAGGLSASTQTVVTGISQPPAVGTDGSVYWSDSSGNILANMPDGSVKWTGGFSSISAGPVAGLDGAMYVIDSGSGLIRVSTDSGSGFAFVSLPAPPVSQLPSAGPDGVVYALTGTDVYGVSADDALLWGPLAMAPAASVTAAAVYAADGTVYFGTDDNKVYAVHSTTSLPAP